jgi:hypothetical protein
MSKKTQKSDYEQIKSFEDACKVSGIETLLPDVSMLPERFRESLIGYYQLMVMVEAVNIDLDESKPFEDRIFKPDYNDGTWKHFPLFYLSGPSGFAFIGDAYWYSYSNVGSRLEYRDRERARYAGKTFIRNYEQAFKIK